MTKEKGVETVKTIRRILIHYGFWAPALAVAILAGLKMAAPYLNETAASIGLIFFVIVAAFGVLHVWMMAPAAKRVRRFSQNND